MLFQVLHFFGKLSQNTLFLRDRINFFLAFCEQGLKSTELEEVNVDSLAQFSVKALDLM